MYERSQVPAKLMTQHLEDIIDKQLFQALSDRTQGLLSVSHTFGFVLNYFVEPNASWEAYSSSSLQDASSMLWQP